MQKAVSTLMNVLLDTCVICLFIFVILNFSNKMIINVFVLIYFIERKDYDNSIFKSKYRQTTS